jgi:hypothetical protein
MMSETETRAAIEAAEDLEAVLATPAGRRLIYRMLGECGVYRSSFSGNSGSFFQEGKRAIGLWLISEMEGVDVTAYPRMLLERAEHRAAVEAMGDGSDRIVAAAATPSSAPRWPQRRGC